MQHELNEQVWLPFRRAYGACDAPAFLALYSRDVVRAGGPTKQIIGYDQYADEIVEWFTGVKERGSSIAIDFRFHERLVGDVVASERGVFRIDTRRASGESKVFYGRFHVFSRKVDGRWLIVADHDTDEGATEDTYLTGVPLP
jgi:ketosteroid isomerase-like protein